MHVLDYMFIFCLALILFGPKKLPEIGRQIGKLMVEFRRASNEFKMQIEEELRASEEAERQKEITAANTMLPTAAAVLPAAEAVAESAATANAESAPAIVPPVTGLPVNHTFSTPEPCEYQVVPEIAATDAFPAEGNGFNTALNSASNGLIAELPVTAETPFPPDAIATDGEESEKAQAPVHHG
jgi:sec-independent protein translocase protein TatB